MILHEFFHPIGVPDSALVLTNQSYNGLKYSRMADASILRVPVSTSIASGHGFDDPMDSIALR